MVNHASQLEDQKIFWWGGIWGRRIPPTQKLISLAEHPGGSFNVNLTQAPCITHQQSN